jgi:hypothetical protein
MSSESRLQIPRAEARDAAAAARLRSLPAAEPPPYGWHEFHRRVAAQRAARNRRLRPTRRTPLALAASVALCLVGAALWLRVAGRGEAVVAQFAGPGAAPPVVAARHYAPDVLPESAPATERARAWLDTVPDRDPAIVRTAVHAAVTDLEDRIAWYDDVMSEAGATGAGADLAALERERARLVASLAQVRYAEALAARLP